MANAIKRISVARGYDVTQYTLQCFGGAGGQHACLVADALGMHDARVHPSAGRRAVGLRHGPGRPDRDARASVERRSMRARLGGGRLAGELAAAARDELAAQGRRRGAIELRSAHAPALPGTDTALIVALPFRRPPARRAFEPAYRQRFAFLMPGRRWWRRRSVEAVGAGEPDATHGAGLPPAPPRRAAGATRPCACRATGGWRDAASTREDAPGGDAVIDPPGHRRRAQRHHRGRARLAGA